MSTTLTLAARAAAAAAIAALTPLAQTPSWTAVANVGQNSSLSSFAVSPDYENDGTVWLAPRAVGAAIWRSTDYGDTFTALSATPNGEEPWVIAVSPTHARDRTLFLSAVEFAGLPHLYKSTDGGASWTRLADPNPVLYAQEIELSPSFAADQLVIVTEVDRRGGAMRSTDGGQTWSFMSQSGFMSTKPIGDVEFAADFATSRQMASAKGLYNYAFNRSDNGGVTWEHCQAYGGVVPCGVINAPKGVEVAPIGSGPERFVFFFGVPDSSGVRALRSADFGVHWQTIGAGLSGAVYDMQAAADYPSSGRVYAATNSGVFVSDDQGTSFRPLAATGLAAGPVVRLELGGGPGGDLYALTGAAHPDPGQLYRLRLSGTGFASLAGAIAGVAGTPRLTGRGPFGQPLLVEIALSTARASAPAAHVIGAARANVPILGGLLVPSPDLVLPWVTDPTGAAALSWSWPGTTPVGTVVYAQDWIVDAAALHGVAATDALGITKL